MTQKKTPHVEHEKTKELSRNGKMAGNCQGPFAEAQSSCSTFPSTFVIVQALTCSCTLKGPARSIHNLSSQIRQKCLPIKALPPSATRFSLNWDCLTTHIIHNCTTTSVRTVETTSPQSSCHTPKNGKLPARSPKKFAFDTASAASQSPTLSKTQPTPVA